jgi:outer membrane protein assembly factor BamB
MKHRSAQIPSLIVILIAAQAVPRISAAENWPTWRGAEGIGVSTDREVPLTWSDKENVRWRVPLPDRGNSTPVVWGDRLFVTQATDKGRRRSVMCLGRADGKLMWQSGMNYAQREPTNGQNPYCSSSPITDGDRVIAFFGSPGLYCYDMDGHELWHREFGRVDSWHGSGSSPIIYGDLCILNFGPGTHAALIACDKKTGEVKWTATPPRKFVGFGWPPAEALKLPDQPATQAVDDKNEPAGKPPTKGREFADAMWQADPTGRGGFMGSWSTPIIWHGQGHDELIVVHPTQVSGYNPTTGEELWKCTGLPDQAFASPALGDHVLVATGHVMIGGTIVTAVRLGGKGDVTDTRRLWQLRLPKECIGSPVVCDGRAYLVTDFGTVVCLDLKTGKKLAEKRFSAEASRSGSWSSLVLVQGKLLCTDQSGEVFIIKSTPELEGVTVNSIGEEITCASPAISDGELFLRTYQSVWCSGKGSAMRQATPDAARPPN